MRIPPGIRIAGVDPPTPICAIANSITSKVLKWHFNTVFFVSPIWTRNSPLVICAVSLRFANLPRAAGR
jgi:hypothetical protein